MDNKYVFLTYTYTPQAGIRYIATASAELLRFRNLMRPLKAIEDFSSEFKMVIGAHKERRILLENNPHLTNWVSIKA